MNSPFKMAIMTVDEKELLKYLSEEGSCFLSTFSSSEILSVLSKIFKIDQNEFVLKRKLMDNDEDITLFNSLHFEDDIFECYVLYKNKFINFAQLFQDNRIEFGNICRGRTGCFQESYIDWKAEENTSEYIYETIKKADTKTFKENMFVRYNWSAM